MASLAKQLGDLNARVEAAKAAGEFIQLVRVLLQSKGDIYLARQATHRVSPRVQDLLKSNHIFSILRRGTAPAGSTSDQFMTVKAAVNSLTLDTGAFANYNLLISGFVNALSSIGVFDQLRSSMRSVPLGLQTLGAVNTAALAYVISEGSAKPVSRLSLSNSSLTPAKAHCVVAVANELLKLGGPDVDALITKELVNASVLAIDSAFIQILLSGVVVGTSAGSTAEAARADLAGLFSAVPSDQTSKYYIITTPLVCKMWASMGASATLGNPAFEDMGPQGGMILNTPVIASDAIAAGTVCLVDASGCAAGSDAIVLSSLSEGSIMSDTSPDSPQVPSSNVVSLWQSNLSAILVERWWSAVKLRSAACAAINNPNSYQTGFSPP